MAKETLREKFGKPHLVADALIKKLLHLPSMGDVDGPSLLEFSRHLDAADRTLTGMGTEYAADLNLTITLRELTKMLPRCSSEKNGLSALGKLLYQIVDLS